MKVAIEIEDAIEEKEYPSKTYCIDFEKGRIAGKCNGMDAIKQFIHKSLITSRGKFPILYSDEYGSDIENAMFNDSPTEEYLKTVIPTLIKDCLLSDDRIIEINDIEVTLNENNLYVSFRVSSDFGEFNYQEVI